MGEWVGTEMGSEIGLVHHRRDDALRAGPVAQYPNLVERCSSDRIEWVVQFNGFIASCACTFRLAREAVLIRRVDVEAVRGAIDRSGLARIEPVRPEARRVADRERIVELVVEAAGDDFHIGLEAVIGGQAVKRVARDRHRFVEDERDAVVGQVVFLLVQVFQREAGVGIDAPGEGRRGAPALIAHIGTIDDGTVLSHQVDARGHRVADNVVHVRGRADFGIRAADNRDIVDREKLGRFGHLVDDAACRAAAEQGRGGTFIDFERTDIKCVAVVKAGVAQPVHEVVVAGREAAQIDEIAMRSAFARV